MAGSIFVFTNHVANIFCSIEGQISNYWIIIIGVITYISIIRRGGGVEFCHFRNNYINFLLQGLMEVRIMGEKSPLEMFLILPSCRPRFQLQGFHQLLRKLLVWLLLLQFQLNIEKFKLYDIKIYQLGDPALTRGVIVYIVQVLDIRAENFRMRYP